MKKLHQYAMILLAGVLGACSSMSVDDLYSDSFPADFNAQEYLNLHPELRIAQVLDAVDAYNENVKKSLGITAYNAAKNKEDSTEFLSNTATLRAIYVDPFIGGGSEAGWAEFSADVTNLKKLYIYNFVGTNEDLAMLQAVPMDYLAISEQYVMYGRTHGWAYRACSVAENANPTRAAYAMTIVDAQSVGKKAEDFVPDPYTYCRDATGVDRVIFQ